MEEPGRLHSMGSLGVRHTERLHFHFSLSSIGEGNGNPLQYSCLENPRDGGACWAAVYGVAQSRTRLKRLSSSSSSSGSVVKNLPAIQEIQVRYLGLGRSRRVGCGNTLQYSCLENPVNCMKTQRYKTLKDELPRFTSTTHPVVDMTGDGSKVS